MDEAWQRAHGAVVELRRYRLHPGAATALVDVFEREFVEPQEACGLRVVGQFRDLDDRDAFVWLRGFAGMAERAAGLAAFYRGPVWAAHRAAANATMVNSDDVLLLRPAALGSGFAPGVRGAGNPGGVLRLTVCALPPGRQAAFAGWFEATLRPLLEAAGSQVLATLVDEPSANTFPALPVRAGESVFVWAEGFADLAALLAADDALARSAAWQATALPGLAERCWRPPQVARLLPTPRSALLLNR